MQIHVLVVSVTAPSADSGTVRLQYLSTAVNDLYLCRLATRNKKIFLSSYGFQIASNA